MNYDIQNKEFVTVETYSSWLHSYTPDDSLYGSHNLYDDAFQLQFGNQNADNNLDILSVNVPQGRLQWYMGDGKGVFNNPQLVNSNSSYSFIRPEIRPVDIDNDTDLDVFVLLNDDTSSTLTVFKNLTLTPTCSSVLDLANSSLNTGVYQAGTTIISSGNVVSGTDVTLKAGNNVILQSGFTVPANSTVKVRISTCN